MALETDDGNPKPPPVDRLSELWRRINEHKIVQWTVAYVAVAYAVQHAVVLTGEAFEWPPAVLRVSMLLMVLGLPVVLTLAWYHGERASRHFSAAELTIVSLLLVIGSVVFYAFVQPREDIAADQAPAAQLTGVEKVRTPAASPRTEISLAVLPFVNLSGDPSREFFSDGMTDEISGALARVPDLRVIARSSAFQFKGQNQDVRNVGQTLGASHLIEGSVRQAGNRVRITAQLVRAGDGVQLWSENYDRELTDIFAIQEQIAQAIAGSLRVPLGLQQGGALVSSRVRDQASYEDYLRARALVRSRGGRGGGTGSSIMYLTDASKLLETVVEREPGFAPAWAMLGYTYGLIPIFEPGFTSGAPDPALIATNLPKANVAASRAVMLDPKNPDGYFSLGFVRYAQGKYFEAADLFRQGVALDASNPDGLHFYSGLLGDLGYVNEAVAMRERLQALEPLVPIYQSVTARTLVTAGQTDAAGRVLGRDTSSVARAIVAAAQGRYGDAADIVSSAKGTDSNSTRELAEQLLRSAPKAVASPQSLPNLGYFSFVYAHVGAAERYLDSLEDYQNIGYHGGAISLVVWGPEFASLRKTERFKTFVRESGYVDYWRARGWPDLCRPVGADDFECS